MNGIDTAGYSVFWHLAGSAGGAPDSVRSFTGSVSEQ